MQTVPTGPSKYLFTELRSNVRNPTQNNTHDTQLQKEHVHEIAFLK